MRVQSLSNDKESRTVVAGLFRKAPVLVEVRFPHMGTSSDWHLCGDEAELMLILERLSPGAELHLNSVWDIKSGHDELVLRR